MPDLATILSFIGAALAMQLVPGPETALVISRGLGQGWRIALCTVLGMTVGAGLIQVPLLALGIASVVQLSPVAFELLRWAGAAYLIWHGGKLLLPSKRRGVILKCGHVEIKPELPDVAPQASRGPQAGTKLPPSAAGKRFRTWSFLTGSS